MQKLFILLCADVEPDRPQFGGKKYDFFGPQSWNGIVRGIPSFLRSRNNFKERLGYDIRVTWFFRADSQIEAIYGDAAFPLTAHNFVVNALLEKGDEIGWHAHMWRWNSNENAWYQEMYDRNWMISCLRQGLSSLKRAGFSPVSFRAGWCFHNNATIATLEELGIKVDVSAMPGIKNLGKTNSEGGSLFDGFCDWRGTPPYPYHPSIENYQIPGKHHYELLEIPVTTFDKPLVSYIHQILPIRISGGIKLAKPDLTISRYPLIATHIPLLFRYGFRSALRDGERSEHVFLVSPFHADELLSNTLMTNLLTNMREVVQICERKKTDVRFLTSMEAYNILKMNWIF